jgi:AcrR family transcriptional regulator
VTDSPEDLRKWRLPRGRHGLPRELVTRSQRERLLAAVVRVTAARGFEATTVADILEEAGVGRESFYELFDDKVDCMMVAHELLVEDLEQRVREAYVGPGDWPDRIIAALEATLRWFAADPPAARFTLVELAAIGSASRPRFQIDFTRFTALIDDGLAGGGPRPQLPGATLLGVSATLARIYEEVVRDRTAELPNLLPELVYEVLVPYLGEDAAQAHVRRVAAA